MGGQGVIVCMDPWEESIENFASLYLNAIKESTNEARTKAHRRQWAGRVEGFAKAYAEKLEELDVEDLQDLIDEMIEDKANPILIEAAEQEQKHRADEGAMA